MKESEKKSSIYDNFLKKVKMFILKYFTLKNVLLTLLLMLIVIGVAVFLGMLLYNLIHLIYFYRGFIIIGIVIIGIVWWYFNSRKKLNPPPESLLSNTVVDDMQMLTYNHNVLKKVLYELISEVANVTNLEAPEKISSLEPPVKWSKIGEVTIYKFICVKRGNADVKAIKQILGTRLQQKLLANEVEGIKVSSTHLFNGDAYPRILIDNVSESGSYVEIAMAFASDKYCAMLQQRNMINHEGFNSGSNWNDKDF